MHVGALSKEWLPEQPGIRIYKPSNGAQDGKGVYSISGKVWKVLTRPVKVKKPCIAWDPCGVKCPSTQRMLGELKVQTRFLLSDLHYAI